MRVVLHTNVLLVSLPSQSKYYPIFEALANDKYSLLLSNDIYLEYLEIITEKASSPVLNRFIELILNLNNITVIDVFYHWDLITNDPDDNKFSDCAIAGNADYLITNNADFRVLNILVFPRCKQLPLKNFLKF